MSADWPWSELGLDGPVDERGVKSAYARQLKQIDRSDADAFQGLRRAFDAARKRATAQSGDAPRRQRPKMSQIARATPSPSTPPEARLRDAAAQDTPPVVLPDPQPPEPAAADLSPPAQPADLHAPPAPQEISAEPARLPDPGPAPRDTIPGAALAEPVFPEDEQLGHTEPDSALQDTLTDILTGIETTLRDDNPNKLDRLEALFAQADNMPGYMRQQVEEKTARVLVAIGARPSAALAQCLEQHFEWVTNATMVQHRLRRIHGLDTLISNLAVALPRKPAKKRKLRVAGVDDDPLTLEEIASLSAMGVTLLWSIVQAILSNDSPVVDFFITVSVTFLMIIVLTLVLEVVWFLSTPFRVIGAELGGAWLVRQAWQRIAPRNLQRWFRLRQPNKRGISLSLACGIVVIAFVSSLIRTGQLPYG